MTPFAGRWFTTFGPMVLTQQDDRVEGHYDLAQGRSTLAGQVSDGRLTFRYEEPTGAVGEGWFELPRFGRFVGQWRPDGAERWGFWQGNREWDGVWETSFGRMRLIQEPDRVFGSYDGLGHSTIEGRLDGSDLVFAYQEPRARGEGCFTLDADAGHFAGSWRVEGVEDWSEWDGRRLTAVPGVLWLAIIEAYWQANLAEVEYSLGAMLGEFFGRLGYVRVRQRFFSNEEGLQRWCRELIYFPEPVVAVVACHGSPEGLVVHGEPIDSTVLIDTLMHADSLLLLHFSSCLTMTGGEAGTFARSLQEQVPFPISGYQTSVEWAASALIEFNYLDMILSKGLSPAEAAEQITQLIGYAGDQPAPGSPYAPAGFRYFAPRKANPATESIPSESEEMG